MCCFSQPSCTGHMHGPVSAGWGDSGFLDPRPSSPELQKNPATHPASSSLLGSAGSPRATNPEELGWKQMGKRERVCLCFYFLPGSALWGKEKKNLARSWCPAKLPPVPCWSKHSTVCADSITAISRNSEKSGPVQSLWIPYICLVAF